MGDSRPDRFPAWASSVSIHIKERIARLAAWFRIIQPIEVTNDWRGLAAQYEKIPIPKNA